MKEVQIRRTVSEWEGFWFPLFSSHLYFFTSKNFLPKVCTAAAAAKSLQSCPTLCDPIDGSPPASPSLGFSRQETGVGCHFPLQCMKVKSENKIAQSYPTPGDPMECSLPGPSVHGIFQARVLEWGAIAFSDPKYVIPGKSEKKNKTIKKIWGSHRIFH